jgi:hypothetical protein
MMATVVLTDEFRPEAGRVYIVKPVGDLKVIVGGGRDVYVIDSVASLQHARQATARYPRTIVCDYIMDPWLLMDRKFHIRMYLLVRAPGYTDRGQPVPFLASLFNEGTMHTAAAPYRAAEWGDKSIHDSHAKSTPHDLYFPYDLPTTPAIIDNIYADMNRAMHGVQHLLCETADSYPESTNAFEVLGVDFMIQGRPDQPRTVLIEINDHVGYTPVLRPDQHFSPHFTDFSPAFAGLSQRYWHWVYRLAIQPFFEDLPPPPSS